MPESAPNAYASVAATFDGVALGHDLEARLASRGLDDAPGAEVVGQRERGAAVRGRECLLWRRRLLVLHLLALRSLVRVHPSPAPHLNAVLDRR